MAQELADNLTPDSSGQDPRILEGKISQPDQPVPPIVEGTQEPTALPTTPFEVSGAGKPGVDGIGPAQAPAGKVIVGPWGQKIPKEEKIDLSQFPNQDVVKVTPGEPDIAEASESQDPIIVLANQAAELKNQAAKLNETAEALFAQIERLKVHKNPNEAGPQLPR